MNFDCSVQNVRAGATTVVSVNLRKPRTGKELARLSKVYLCQSHDRVCYVRNCLLIREDKRKS